MLLDPNIAFVLYVVAMLGIYLEIAHPGAIVPGIVGTLSFLGFLFVASALEPNWTGLALMLLASVLLVLDVKLSVHGVLTVCAIVSLVVGAFIFFSTDKANGAQLSPLLVYAVAAIVGIIGFIVVRFAMRVRGMLVTTGVEGMLGATVYAKTPLLPEGRVRYAGEDWAAVLDDPTASVDPGTKLQIVAVDGLRLRVQPKAMMLQENIQEMS